MEVEAPHKTLIIPIWFIVFSDCKKGFSTVAREYPMVLCSRTKPVSH